MPVHINARVSTPTRRPLVGVLFFLYLLFIVLLEVDKGNTALHS